MEAISLPAELEQFASDAVAAGRYRDLTEVVQAGLTLLQQAEADVAAFVATLEAARAEGVRDGFLSAEDVHRDMTTMLDELTRLGA